MRRRRALVALTFRIAISALASPPSGMIALALPRCSARKVTQCTAGWEAGRQGTVYPAR
jgi:hypothetical protein